MVFVRGRVSPPETPRAAPRIENNALGQGTPPGRDDDGIMFPRPVHICHGELQFEGLKIEDLQAREEIIGPVIAKAAIAKTEVDQIVMEPWRPDSLVFAGQLHWKFNGCLGQPISFIGFDPVAKVQ
jgi:hypothetical protein